MLIVWDGARSTILALEALVRSKARHFVLAESGRVRPSADDAAAWLRSHGSSAEVRRFSTAPGAGLRDLCEAMQPASCMANQFCAHGSIAAAFGDSHERGA